MTVSAKIIRLTFLGGALGTLVRFGLLLIIGNVFSIIFVNLAGSALIGWLNGNKKYDTDEQNALWKIGFAGGFTTMSSFASLIVLYSQAVAIVAIGLTLLVTAIGLGVYWLSFKISRDRSRS